MVDPSGNRLWMLDTGTIRMGSVKPGGAKPLAVDLDTNQIVKKFIFPSAVALTNSSMNACDLTCIGVLKVRLSSPTPRPRVRTAPLYLISRQEKLATFEQSPIDEAGCRPLPVVEGDILQLRLPGQRPAKFAVGSDGIALSPDGKTL